jgi:hypothetical protein
MQDADADPLLNHSGLRHGLSSDIKSLRGGIASRYAYYICVAITSEGQCEK